MAMSLKCSIFGHSFGDPDVEREREEEGSEVVITIRELETCARCEETRVVSENKEVTTLETPDLDAGDDDAGGETGDRDDAGAVAGSARADHASDATDAAVVDEETATPVGDEGSTGAEVLDDDPIPDAEGGTSAPSTDAGDAAGSNVATATETGSDTTPAADEDDAIILDDGDGADDGPREPGEWPETTEGDAPDWVTESESTAPPDPDDGPEIESPGTAVTVPEGEFHCPECGFRTAVESSSLRAGDFCPECHEGSLQHEPE